MPLAAVVDGHIFCTHGGIPEERKYDQVGFKRAVNNIPGTVYSFALVRFYVFNELARTKTLKSAVDRPRTSISFSLGFNVGGSSTRN